MFSSLSSRFIDLEASAEAGAHVSSAISLEAGDMVPDPVAQPNSGSELSSLLLPPKLGIAEHRLCLAVVGD